MAPEIRGSGEAMTRMLLGQIRKVFDPEYVQQFDKGGSYEFTVQFRTDTPAADELIAFAEMYGFEVTEKADRTWTAYYFQRE